MQNRKITILIILSLISLQTLSLGAPKAYEAINYQGKANGRLVKLMLANGYIGASTLKIVLTSKMKPIVFEPDVNVVDERKRLKFVSASQSYPYYFILDNMQEAYKQTPAFITGVCFGNGKKVPVKLELLKDHLH